MGYRGKPVIDLELGAEFIKSLIVELSPVIGDENPGQTKSTYDILPDEVPGFMLCYLGCRLGFHPFGEVVNCDK